jgi:hypothetical protein
MVDRWKRMSKTDPGSKTNLKKWCYPGKDRVYIKSNV